MGMATRLEYKTVKIICNKCNEELHARFEQVTVDGPTDTFYACGCGETKVTSDKYHAYRDYSTNKVKQDEVDILVSAMSSMVNSYSTDKIDMFIKGMGNQHRTLQQSFTGVCLAWIKHLEGCGKSGNYDARNEASVKLAMEIMERVENAQYRLPMV